MLAESDYWAFDGGIDTDAYMIITITGTNNITFTGGSVPFPPTQLSWNIIDGHSFVIGQGGMKGSVVAPYSAFSQGAGDLMGFVVAYNILHLESVHKPACVLSPKSCLCCAKCPMNECNQTSIRDGIPDWGFQ